MNHIVLSIHGTGVTTGLRLYRHLPSSLRRSSRPRRVPARELPGFGPKQLRGASLKKRELSCILPGSLLKLLAIYLFLSAAYPLLWGSNRAGCRALNFSFGDLDGRPDATPIAMIGALRGTAALIRKQQSALELYLKPSHKMLLCCFL